jgi:polar amino acid transport system permease protein
VFSAIWSVLHPVLATVDPLCGPVGIFSLFGGHGELSCGGAGWGDEIAFGFYVTASLALCTLPLGLTVGFFLALAKQSPAAQLRTAADIYTSLFRALPELLTLSIIYYGLPGLLQMAVTPLGITAPVEINPFVAGMIAIGIVFSSYCSEVLLSAFRAIPIGQYEGGYAIGLTHGQTMRLIVLPQLVRIALPGLGNLWMVLLKDTALVSVVGLPDILRQTFIAAKVTKHAFTFTGIACLLFLVLAILSSFIINWLEARGKRSEVRR